MLKDNLVMLRNLRGFTQEELAEQIGVTSQAVSKWENNTGLPDISQVVPLANFFGVSTIHSSISARMTRRGKSKNTNPAPKPCGTREKCRRRSHSGEKRSKNIPGTTSA